MMHAGTQRAAVPIILFGAFDRHNFGDLLFPHVAAALLKDKHLVFAGLAERDLRSCGGHQVRALARLAAEWNERPVHIMHVGGEILTCDAWQAAVMLLPPEQAQHIILHFSSRPQERNEWAHSQLGIPAAAPYILSRALFPRADKVIYNAIGGVELAACDPAMRTEVLANLRAADAVSVRDRQTQSLLNAAGITARLLPDPAVMVAELFGKTIGERMQQGEVAQVARAFAQGFVAVQFSTDFADDKTLTQIAVQLDRIACSTGLGVVFFRAGAAPWHDDLRGYQRVAARMRTPSTIFSSLQLWNICALIARSRAYIGSSLHGRIVAMAFALPRMNLRHPGQTAWPTKQAAYATTWEEQGMPVSVDVHNIAQGIEQALCVDGGQLRHKAAELAARYREGFNAICAGLE